MDFEKYLKHLKLHPERFKNMKVLDVGCGPVPYALVFRDCEMYGVDPLISYYRDIGYPMHFDQREMRYIDSPIEAIPVEDDYFDAVISVNALDHVDDFYKASEEINRVLKPDGLLVFEIHSHEPRVGHPWKITTEMIQESFGDRGITKVYENDYSFFYSEKDKDELLSVWSNAHMN
jgi:ubiquinone/menaquinone biosynthesis C-methylase UbiE